jgi:hypothetical protein
MDGAKEFAEVFGGEVLVDSEMGGFSSSFLDVVENF